MAYSVPDQWILTFLAICFKIAPHTSFKTHWCCGFFFLLRKISPELATASPPLFAEEARPWDNICAHLPLLYMWTPTTAWRAKRCHVRTRDPNRQTLGHQGVERAHLTAAPPGRPDAVFNLKNYQYKRIKIRVYFSFEGIIK